MSTREEVYKAIDGERDYQNTRISNKFGHQPNEPVHPVAAEVLMINEYAERAQQAWTNEKGVEPALNVIRKIAGLCVRCMENHGALPRE